MPAGDSVCHSTENVVRPSAGSRNAPAPSQVLSAPELPWYVMLQPLFPQPGALSFTTALTPLGGAGRGIARDTEVDDGESTPSSQSPARRKYGAERSSVQSR